MIAAIELAILQVLRGAGSEEGPLGYRYVTLATFPDEFDEYLKSVPNLRTPAGWIVFLGLDDASDDGDETGLAARLRFALVVAAQNQRNEQETRHGKDAMIGSYQLATDAMRLLSRNDLGLDLIEPITVRGARLVSRSEQMRAQKLSMVAIELACRVPIGALDEVLGEFRTFHADWDVPAFGNVAAPLPSAQHDAEDQVELPYD
jgi:phage gp37-like protein